MPVSRVGEGLFRSRKVYNPFQKIPPPTLPLTLVDLVFGKPLLWPTPSPRSLLFGRLVPCQVLGTHISWNPCHVRSKEWPESLVLDQDIASPSMRITLHRHLSSILFISEYQFRLVGRLHDQHESTSRTLWFTQYLPHVFLWICALICIFFLKAALTETKNGEKNQFQQKLAYFT